MTDTTRTDATDRALPEPMAERFRVVLGLDEPPATVGDWADAVTAFFDAEGVTIGPDDLCTTEESRHEARFGAEERSNDGGDGAGNTTRHYRCVLDALLVPFVHDEPGAVEVRTRSPVSDAVIEATVESGVGALDGGSGADGIDAEPETAVVSLGVAADAPPASEIEGSPLEAYELFCPYVNGFADREEYETWAAETPEAETTALTVPVAFEVARRLAERAPASSE